MVERDASVVGADAAADELANTPAICRRSYVHDTVVTAFEKGLLERFAATLKSCRSPAARETALAQVAEASAATAAPLSGARLVGQGVLRFLGFEIYRARLWVQPGFDADNYAAHPLALELTYHRDFSADAIAKRSIEEMRRVGSFTPQQATRWQQALSADRPTVLDIRCDPNVPPIPPHASFEQVKAMASSVWHGDEDAWGFIKEGFKQKVQEYLPGAKRP